MRPAALASAAVFAALLLVATACAPAVAPGPRPPAATPAPAPPPGTQVERAREQLQVAPWDLAFSAVHGAEAVVETVSARNMVDHPVEIGALLVFGDDAPLFQLRDRPPLPARLPPQGRISVGVTFAPPAGAKLGVRRALLRFQTGPSHDDGPGVDLAALVTSGRVDDHEPTLAAIVEVLGYAVDVDHPFEPARASKPGSTPAGDEDPPLLFQRANAAPVALNPVARFSTDGPVPYGHFDLVPPKQESTGLVLGNLIDSRTIATLAAGQNQTLNPEMDPGGSTSFDPGEHVFGLWMQFGKHVIVYSDPRKNRERRAQMRAYALKARGGAPVPNAFLVAVEQSTGGASPDFQDGVFVLWNVKPVARPWND